MHQNASMTAKLTPKQAKFKLEYAKDLNGTKAAIRAGYSEKGASVAATRLLRDVRISKAIEEKVEKVMNSLEITVDRVLAERARLAFFDIRKLVHPDGRPKALNEIDDDTAAAIAGLDVVNVASDGQDIGQVLKFKISDKNVALAALEKHLGIGKEDTGGSGVLNIILNLG